MSSSNMSSSKEFESYARYCVRLAEQADTPLLRETLLQMAREWMQAIMDEEDTTCASRQQPTCEEDTTCASRQQPTCEADITCANRQQPTCDGVEAGGCGSSRLER
jgi:hypothetical protein